MFVRFKKIISRRKGPILNLSVQESFRSQSELGRVKSRTICGLGSIRQSAGPFEREQFWTELDKRLPRLRLAGRLSASDELKVRQQLQQRIPRL